MIRKLLEALFRHKWLLLLPTFLVPIVVTPIAIISAPVYYESDAGVWVDHPVYLAKNADPYASAAATQAGQITELLHTRTFMLDVIKRTSLAPLLNVKSGEARATDLLTKGVIVAAVPGGGHLLTIQSRFSTPQLAQQVTQAVIDAYNDRTSNQQLDQSGVAISFFQDQLQSAQDDLNKATTNLAQYAIAMGYASADGSPVGQDVTAASALDSKYADYSSTVKFAQAQVDSARGALQNAQISSAETVEGANFGFQVIDPPQLPTAPSTSLKSALVYTVAALVIGLGISCTLLVLLVAGDRSVRRDADLQPPMRVLGVVPMLKLKKPVPKALRPTATRRAIGFVAGSALPAPGGSR